MPSPKGGGGEGGWLGGELEPDHKEDGQFPKQLIEDRPGAVEDMAVDGDVVEHSGYPGGGAAAAAGLPGGGRSLEARAGGAGQGKTASTPALAVGAWAVHSRAQFPPQRQAASLIFSDIRQSLQTGCLIRRWELGSRETELRFQSSAAGRPLARPGVAR